jgi:hypothetical protein
MAADAINSHAANMRMKNDFFGKIVHHSLQLRYSSYIWLSIVTFLVVLKRRKRGMSTWGKQTKSRVSESLWLGLATGFGATVALWNPRRAKRSARLAGAGVGLSAVLGVLAALAGYVSPESFLFFVLGVAAGFLSALVVGRFPELD